jgi:hypothetical protein
MVDQPGATTPADSSAQTPEAAAAAAAAAAAKTAAAAATPAAHAPAFEYENGVMDENFNLRPLPSFRGTIPEDQRKVSQDVYEARNVLKLLKDDQAITDALFKEFIARDTQAGFAGCVASNVDPTLAAEALVQIRADIVRRVGTPLVYRYLRTLALYALVGGVLGFAIAYFGISHPGSNYLPFLKGYGLVLIGAMAGAWFSVAASRWQIAFDTIPDYLDINLEPAIRMLFVALVAAVFALFLHLGIITVKIGDLDLKSFISSIKVAILLGFVAGISQRALSVQLVDRATKVINPGK